MNRIEILRFALRGLLANKLRSALTTLGILIGVAAVIMLVAVGEGSSRSIQQNIQRLGANTLTISPSFSGGGGGGVRGPAGGGGNTGPRTQARQLSLADAKALTDRTLAPSVKSVSPIVNAPSATAAYGAASHTIAQFVGTYPSYFEAVNKPVSEGTYFFNDDVLAARKVVVLGRTVAGELFGDADPIGRRISVSGVPFTVVGVLKASGSTGMQDADDVAVAPLLYRAAEPERVRPARPDRRAGHRCGHHDDGPGRGHGYPQPTTRHHERQSRLPHTQPGHVAGDRQ